MRRARNFLARAVAVASVVVGLPFPATAAEHTGRVTFGTVPVPGATVSAARAGAETFVTVTDEAGTYRFTDLPDGVWDVRVEMPGFAPMTRTVMVGPDPEAATWTLTLPPFEEIVAVAEPAELDGLGEDATANDGLATSGRLVAGPSTDADFRRVAVAATPSGADPAPAGTPLDPEAAEELARQARDGFLINGSVNNGAASPFALSAAFGNNRPGFRSLYTGGIGVILGNSAWDARPFALAGRETLKPDYSDVQVAGVFGGPLRLPGLVERGPNLFLGYQRTANHTATTQVALVPTGLERSGDFSRSVDAFGRPVEIRDPTTGQPFPDGRISAGRLSPQAQALLAYYPQPNVTGGGAYNYQAELVGLTRRDSLESRLGPIGFGRDQLSFDGVYDATTVELVDVFGFADTTRTTRVEVGASWIRRLSRWSSHRLQYRFGRAAGRTSPFFAYRTNVSGLAGILGNDQAPENWGPPRLLFSSGLVGIGQPAFASNVDRTDRIASDTLVNRGRHNLAFGARVTRQAFALDSQQDARGTFSFTGTTAFGTGSDLADFLLGIPTTSAIAFGNADKFLRGTTVHAYVNDDWRMTPGFTFNVGVRWEYEHPLRERFDRLVNLDVADGFTAVSPVLASDPVGSLTGVRYPSALLTSDPWGGQPRLGIAWRPVAGSSLVMRAGYGVYRNTDVYRGLTLQLAQQPPLSTTQRLENDPARPLTLADAFPVVEGVATNTFAVDPDLRVGYVQSWQASVQRDLPASLTVSATYLGSKGSRLMQQVLPNTVPPGAEPVCAACPRGFVYLTSNGTSLRHAGQFQIRRRMRNGFTATAEYTLAKSTDNAASFAGIEGGDIAQDWRDLEAERARSDFDQRHRFTLQAQYTTGQGIAGGTLIDGWRGRLFKDWTFVGQLTVGSGRPLTPVYLAAVGGTGLTGTIRAALTGVSTEALVDGVYANPAGFAAPALGTWGDAGRNSISGPTEFALDAGIGRTFRWGDRLNLDWRLDATNVLNRVTFADVTMLVGSPLFGLPNRANAMRKIQSTLRLRF